MVNMATKIPNINRVTINLLNADARQFYRIMAHHSRETGTKLKPVQVARIVFGEAAKKIGAGK